MKIIYCATSLPLNSELHQEPPLMFCACLEGDATPTCQALLPARLLNHFPTACGSEVMTECCFLCLTCVKMTDFAEREKPYRLPGKNKPITFCPCKQCRTKAKPCPHFYSAVAALQLPDQERSTREQRYLWGDTNSSPASPPSGRGRSPSTPEE